MCIGIWGGGLVSGNGEEWHGQSRLGMYLGSLGEERGKGVKRREKQGN